MAVGQKVSATVDAFPGKSFVGQIMAVNPAIAAESRSFMVEARVPNAEATLKPGMFAVATIDQGSTERSLLVPRRAVIEDTNTNSFRVFVIDEHRSRTSALSSSRRGSRPTWRTSSRG